MKVNEFQVGDLIRFSQKHREKPGLDYTNDWFGIVIEMIPNDFAPVYKEIKILWSLPPASGSGLRVMEYPSSWWNSLMYEPFEEVIK